MTNTELKAQIDSQITNETTQDSVSPIDVGGNIKAVVDYTDQEIATVVSYVDQEVSKTLSFSLTSAEILALRTSPKVLIPAQAGKVFLATLIYYKYTHVSTAYTNSGGGFSLSYDVASNSLVNFSTVLFETQNTFAYATPFYSTLKTSTYENKDFLLTTASSNPTGGNGTLEFYISYKEITV